MKIKLSNILPKFHYLIYILLLFPLVFPIGANMFSKLGKFYYLGVLFLSYIDLLIRCEGNQTSIKLRKKNNSRKLMIFIERFTLVILGISILLLFTYLFMEIDTNDFLFLILIILFLIYVSSLKLTNAILVMYGKISFLLLLMFFFQTIIMGKPSYFNPNTYAFLSNILFFMSTLFILNQNKNKTILFIITALISIYLSYIIFKSETELFAVLLYSFMILFRKDFFRNKSSFFLITTFTFVFFIGLPFISSYLIDLNILDDSFISSRGYRWHKSIELISVSGFFSPSTIINSHNCFLEVAIRYSMFISIIIFLSIYVLLLSFYKIVKMDLISKIIYINIICILFINSVESLFLNLTDAYYLFINIGFLLSRQIQFTNLKKYYIRSVNNE